MLEEFLVANRDAIITRTRARVASRISPRATEAEANGIPIFLDQLGAALRLAGASNVVDHTQMKLSAGLHGQALLQMGLTIAQVVHDYGDVCQVVTQLAIEQNAPIPAEEFRTLNLCLDDAMAQSVTEFSRQRELVIERQGTERIGMLAHELRNVLNAATLSFELISSGRVAAGGSTSAVLGRSLLNLASLIDRSLVDVRLDSGTQYHERISVAELVEEVEITASMQAKDQGIRFTIAPVENTGAIDGDRQILAAALSNLLQNAFKFSHQGGHVSLGARVGTDRVIFDIEDECGGLPPGGSEDLFRPFEQRGANRSGLGLGLSICLKAARAHAGAIRVQDLPGKGCIFSLDLPRSL